MSLNARVDIAANLSLPVIRLAAWKIHSFFSLVLSGVSTLRLLVLVKTPLDSLLADPNL